MALIVALLTLLCLHQVLCEDVANPVHCDVPEKAELEAKLNRLIRHLPKEHRVIKTNKELLPGAIFLGEGILYNLDALTPDRPYKTFCRGEDKVTLFSLRSRYRIHMAIPWRICSGHNGTIITYAQRVRYEGELVTRETDDGRVSRIENMWPVTLEAFEVGMRGGGETLNMIANVLGVIFSGPVRLFWDEAVTAYVQEAFKETLNEVK